MPNTQPEYLRAASSSEERRPKLIAIADQLISELPEKCRRCPWALAVRSAVSEDDWWLPRTPPGSRFMVSKGDGSSYMVSPTAEHALRSIVRESNVTGQGAGPIGEDSPVCCLDTRPIEHPNYTSPNY